MEEIERQRLLSSDGDVGGQRRGQKEVVDEGAVVYVIWGWLEKIERGWSGPQR